MRICAVHTMRYGWTIYTRIECGRGKNVEKISSLFKQKSIQKWDVHFPIAMMVYLTRHQHQSHQLEKKKETIKCWKISKFTIPAHSLFNENESTLEHYSKWVNFISRNDQIIILTDIRSHAQWGSKQRATAADPRILETLSFRCWWERTFRMGESENLKIERWNQIGYLKHLNYNFYQFNWIISR